MAVNPKAFGNALANKLRTFEDNTSEQEDPNNMAKPAEETTEAPAVTIPVASFPDAMEGDTYTVTAVDEQNVTLAKQ